MVEIRKPDAALTRILPPVSARPGINYIPSRYALPFAHGGKQYVFHNLTKQCIEGTLPTSARAGEGHDDLIAAQFLVPESKDECAYYNQISALMRSFSRKKGVRSYTVLPTMGCNARCVYCYEEGMKPVTMAPETVEQVIRYILGTHCSGRVSLSWFGGEPLLGAGIIDRVCEGIREAGLDYESDMVSNGSLITPEIITRMTERWRLSSIQLSMDGAERDYISRKRYYTDRDYYHKVIRAAGDMSAAGVAVTIRCNVDGENWSRVPQFLEDLRSGVLHKDKVSVYFAPTYDLRRSENCVAMWENIRDARRRIEEAGFHASRLIGLCLGFRVNRCMADGGGVVISPDGGLYLCEHCQGRFGDIWHGVTDEAARREFSRADRTREECRSCPFLPDCTSFAGCPVRDAHCRQVHELMVVDALKRMVEQTGREDADGADLLC